MVILLPFSALIQYHYGSLLQPLGNSRFRNLAGFPGNLLFFEKGRLAHPLRIPGLFHGEKGA